MKIYGLLSFLLAVGLFVCRPNLAHFTRLIYRVLTLNGHLSITIRNFTLIVCKDKIQSKAIVLRLDSLDFTYRFYAPVAVCERRTFPKPCY